MAAATTRTFPRHTHDQYGMGVIDSGGHASSSGRGQVEAGPGSLIFVNPGEVHDGRPIGRRARSWRMLYLDPTLMEELRADVLDGTNPSFTFAAPVFVDENLRRLFDAAFARATAKEGFHDAMGCETALLHLAARVEVNATARSRSPVGPAPCIRRVRDRIDADPSARHRVATPQAPAELLQFCPRSPASQDGTLAPSSQAVQIMPSKYIGSQRVSAVARKIYSQGSHP
jgi:AraC-like ligand binding domain